MALETVRVLRAEHDAIRAVLAHLEAAVAAAERGVAVPRDLFTDIQEFFTVFVDRCHHGKEESVIFPRLAIPRRVAGSLPRRARTQRTWPTTSTARPKRCSRPSSRRWRLTIAPWRRRSSVSRWSASAPGRTSACTR